MSPLPTALSPLARFITDSAAAESTFTDAQIEYLPIGGRWRTLSCAGNYATNLRPTTDGLVVLVDGLERDFTAGEQIEFAQDFEDLVIGVSPETYLDMIINYISTGNLGSRSITLETGDSTHGGGI